MPIFNRKTSAYVADFQAVPNPCNLYGFSVYNSGGTQIFLQLFDEATTPANGATPDVFYTVAANSEKLFYFGEKGMPLYNGLYICNSTTDITKTLGAGVCWFHVQVSPMENN